MWSMMVGKQCEWIYTNESKYLQSHWYTNVERDWWWATHGLMYISGIQVVLVNRWWRGACIQPSDCWPAPYCSSPVIDVVSRFEQISFDTWFYCLNQSTNLQILDYLHHNLSVPWSSVTFFLFPFGLWKQREAFALPQATAIQCLPICIVQPWTIQRNLDITRQDVQKAAVAACTIAGFW